MPGMLQPKRELIWRINGDAWVKIWPIIGGEPEERILHITHESYSAWQDGLNIYDAFPNLNAEQREWLMSGINGEAWTGIFSDIDDD